MEKKPIIVSGIQPTGNLHIGNYLGAVKNWVSLQNSGKYQMYIFIADLHSLTGNMKAEERKSQIIRTAAELLSAGIDPNKVTVFVQSHVEGHAELAWILGCVTPIAELERMTQYKDKAIVQKRNVNSGLLTYPVLQAADILLYHGKLVPVGQDQIQHVELTANISKWFNNRFGEYFPEVGHILTHVPKVMSLLEPDKKMSKSLGMGHVIELADEPAVISKKIKKAVTATIGGKQAPGVANLLMLLENFGDNVLHNSFLQSEKQGTIKYGELKEAVVKAISEYFLVFRERRKQLLDDQDKITDILSNGAKKASLIAEATISDVRKMVGLS